MNISEVTTDPDVVRSLAAHLLDLRPIVSPLEVEAAVELAREVAKEKGITDASEKQFRRSLRAIGIAKGLRLILRVSGQPAGFVAGHLRQNGMREGLDAALGFLIVSRDHRQRGYGRILHRAFEQWGRRAGARRMFCGAMVGSPGLRIFETEGYETSEIFYEKELSP